MTMQQQRVEPTQESHAPDPERFAALTKQIKARMKERSQYWSSRGFPQIQAEGKLLRPLIACCVAQAMDAELLDDGVFWDAVLAIQMVHEASLMHDDIIDRSDTRRGRPTLFASHGVGPALVAGDHLLTAAYRLVANAESPLLFKRFAEAVEQTVAGEIEQAKTRGKPLTSYDYTSMIAKKSGALFAFSMSIAPILRDDRRANAMWLCGLRLGCQYQRLDDILDYCGEAVTGKPPLQDFRQQKPTWPWIDDDQFSWELSEEEVMQRLFAPDGDGGHSMARLLHEQFEGFGEVLREELMWHFSNAAVPLCDLLILWENKVADAIDAEEAGLRSTVIKIDFGPSSGSATSESPDAASLSVTSNVIDLGQVAALRKLLVEEGLFDPGRWDHYFAQNSRSFSFAASWFPPKQREQIAGIYAYCRCTDELADGFGDLTPQQRCDLLNAWEVLTIQAYEGESTGFPLLDTVIAEMGREAVPLQVALDLIKGMRMDVGGESFATGETLLEYCHCVASTVGLWCTHLFATDDPWVLERADALGKAMQLTNIMRDVGEDLGRGRVYLPDALLDAHGVTVDALHQMMSGEQPISDAYIRLLESLMAQVDHLYEQAFEAMAYLPKFFAQPVAVAAEVYRGIHEEIRRNGYDNLRLRAHTSWLRKLWLAGVGLWKLRKSKKAKAHNERLVLSGRPSRRKPLQLASSLMLESISTGNPPFSDS